MATRAIAEFLTSSGPSPGIHPTSRAPRMQNAHAHKSDTGRPAHPRSLVDRPQGFSRRSPRRHLPHLAPTGACAFLGLHLPQRTLPDTVRHAPSATPRPPTRTNSVHRPSSTARTAPPDPTFALPPAPGAGRTPCPASSYVFPNLTLVTGPSGSPRRPSPSHQRVSRVLVERQSCASGPGQSG